MQVLTAYKRFSRHKKDVSDLSSDMFLDMVNSLHRFIYPKLVNVNPEKFISTQSYTVANDDSSAALPTDFKRLNVLGAGVFYTDSNGAITDTPLPLTGAGSCETGYYISNNLIYFTNMGAGTYIMRYVPKLTAITSTSDYFTVDKTSTGKETIPDDFLEYVVGALDVLFAQWDEDIDMEGITDQRFARFLSELLDDKQVSSVFFLP